MLGPDKENLGCVINEGRRYDLGNFSRTRLSGKQLERTTLAKARYGFMPVFQQSE